MQLARYVHSIRYLKPVQVYGRLRRYWGRRPGRFAGVAALRPPQPGWLGGISRPPAQAGPLRFRFLNDTRQLAGPDRWHPPEVSRLWLYNLHYCDDLNASGHQGAAGKALIASWIEGNPPGRGAGWDPYPLSLRIVNWVKWSLAGGELTPAAVHSLALQAAYLAGGVEYAILGNHLFENAKALVFAGCALDCSAAAGWLAGGLGILARQVSEQVLADGGHFERSPMYHAIFLEGLLDLVHLNRVYPGRIPPAQVDSWRSSAVAMLRWLELMCHPDGEIALFNDAAFGIAPRLAQLGDYAARLGIACHVPAAGPEPAVHCLAESGYARLSAGPSVVIFDGGPLGPDYQPGHAHADTLSFELSRSGRRIIVDSGTSTYECGSQRGRERGTAAHNTLRLDGMDQSEVWGSFRVARRARPTGLRTGCSAAGAFAAAGHDGYRRLRRPVVHRREIVLSSSRLAIADTLEGGGTHTVHLALHLAPGLVLRPEGAHRMAVLRSNSRIASIEVDPRMSAAPAASTYHPEFGLAVPNSKLEAVWRSACPATFVSTIEFSDQADLP